MVDWRGIGEKLGYNLGGERKKDPKALNTGSDIARGRQKREDTVVEGVDAIRDGFRENATTVVEGVGGEPEELRAKELQQMELDFERFLQGGEISYSDLLKLWEILKQELQKKLNLSDQEVNRLSMTLATSPKRPKEEEDYVQIVKSSPINVEEFKKLWDKIGADTSTKRVLMDCVKATLNWSAERDQRKLDGELRKQELNRRIRGILAIKHEITFGDWFHIFYPYGVGDWLGALYKTKKVGNNRDILEFADGADAKIMELLARLPLEEVEKIVDYLESKYNEGRLRKMPKVVTPGMEQVAAENDNLKTKKREILQIFLALSEFGKKSFFKTLNIAGVLDYDTLAEHLDNLESIAEVERIHNFVQTL